MRTPLVLAAALALGACASRMQSGSDAARNQGERLVRYTCAGGATLSTFRKANGDIDVEWNGRRWTLVSTQSGVGQIWTDGNLSFRERGQDVYLEERGIEVLRDCQVWR